MSEPRRVQLSRRKGWKMPPNTVKVDRTTHWGNPFVIGEKPDARLLRKWLWELTPQGRAFITADAAEAVERFKSCIAFDSASKYAADKELRGKNLACWCPLDAPCHADVLLKVANAGGERPTK